MSRDEAYEAELSADERALIDRLCADPPETPSAAARERAQLAFVHGEGEPLRLHPRLTAYQRWGGILAAAAILLLVVLQYGQQPVDRWRVTDVTDAAGVEGIEGGATLGATFTRGTVRTDANTELEVQLGQDLQMRLVPGTLVELPSGPGRWFGKARTLRLLAGEVYGTSAGGELGWRLTLAGRDAEAQLTGTTFAIFLREETTCFCLFEGGLRVKVLATGETIELPVGQRVWVYGDGRTDIAPLDGGETMKLQMSRDRGIRPE